NQHVNAGDLLFRLDPAPYRIALMQAQAALGTAKAGVTELAGTYDSKQADTANKAAMVGAAQAQVALDAETYRRQSALMARGFTTRAQLDAAHAALVASQAGVTAAISAQRSAGETATAAKARLAVDGSGINPAIEAAQAAVDKAQLDLSRTEIRAPVSGVVAQADKLQPGNLAVQALPQLSIVNENGYWVDANFKETQLDKIRVGQRADIEIDAIPGKIFHARVSSLGAGTGAQFSILPAQNATGNWVKVTQRVPVRLTFIDPPGPLAAGWSANVTVHIKN
ncbi:MAG: HlyD family secretion protein, partial [Alphaproteobacteria bacterium]|nr:HlyD family secretion protein [Alphaproteobacteria bacterium]